MTDYQMKRQRGRGRKPGGGHHHQSHTNNHGHQHPNRMLESNGPDMKVRGPAAHVYERYLQLARDAASAGDRVTAENNLQHAEHYFRVLRAMQPSMPPPQSGDRYGSEQNFEGDDEGGAEGDNGSGNETGAQGGDQPDVEFPGGQAPHTQQGLGADRDGDGGFRRRRGRRSRFRPDGERGEGAETAREGGERQSRPERETHERGGESPSVAEGFSSGPKPAFLRSD